MSQEMTSRSWLTTVLTWRRQMAAYLVGGLKILALYWCRCRDLEMGHTLVDLVAFGRLSMRGGD